MTRTQRATVDVFLMALRAFEAVSRLPLEEGPSMSKKGSYAGPIKRSAEKEMNRSTGPGSDGGQAGR
ncbi:MAG: hypothetical protein ACYTFA_00620 [Planctomycetota bacterium]|jgi:hypothetical protein